MKIFVVDDEKNIRRSLEMILKRQHQISLWESAEDMLTALEKEKPDIMFLDVQLPGISGIEALKKSATNVAELSGVNDFRSCYFAARD